jgi:hypothetical protein
MNSSKRYGWLATFLVFGISGCLGVTPNETTGGGGGGDGGSGGEGGGDLVDADPDGAPTGDGYYQCPEDGLGNPKIGTLLGGVACDCDDTTVAINPGVKDVIAACDALHKAGKLPTDGKVDVNCDGTPENCNELLGLCAAGATQSCYTGAVPATQTVGICHAGVQTCDTNGKFGACVGDQTPLAKNCNSSQDNDCNGMPDATETECIGNGQCQPGATQNCYTGPASTDGVGACHGGTQICDSNGNWGACLGETLPGSETTALVCADGLDNDCDGWIDMADASCAQAGVCQNGAMQSCYNGANGTDGVGACHGGTQTCVSGAWGVCVNEVTPVTEICADNIDNDCDGTKDEAGCQGGNGAVCSATVTGSYTPPNGAGSITWNFYQVCSSTPGNGASSSSSPVTLTFTATPGTAVELNGQITGFGWICSEPQQNNPVVAFGVPSLPGYSYSGKLTSGASMGPGTYGYAHDVNAPGNWGCNIYVCPATPAGQVAMNCIVQ